MRWLIVFLLAFVVFQGLAGWLRRIGLGRLPGDFSVRWKGRVFHVPLASSLLLSLVAMAIGVLV
jgi:heme A synthase